MRRLFALFVAGTLATSSVALAESCPAMRAHALKRCCCPPSPQGHARLTCCEAKNPNDSRMAALDRPDEPHFIVAAVSTPWSFARLVPSSFAPPPTTALVASAAGPPLVALRI